MVSAYGGESPPWVGSASRLGVKRAPETTPSSAGRELPVARLLHRSMQLGPPHEMALQMVSAQGGIFGWVADSEALLAALPVPSTAGQGV